MIGGLQNITRFPSSEEDPVHPFCMRSVTVGEPHPHTGIDAAALSAFFNPGGIPFLV